VNAVGSILKPAGLTETCGPQINDNTHPFDRLRAWVIRILLAIGKWHVDVDWFDKGNQLLATLSKFRRAEFIYQQIYCTDFYLLQLMPSNPNLNMPAYIYEWMTSYLQVRSVIVCSRKYIYLILGIFYAAICQQLLALWNPDISLDIIARLARPHSSMMQVRRHYVNFDRFFGETLDLVYVVLQTSVKTAQHTREGEFSLVRELALEIGEKMRQILKRAAAVRAQIFGKFVHWQHIIDMAGVIENSALSDLCNELSVTMQDALTDAHRISTISQLSNDTLILLHDLKVLIMLARSWNFDQEVLWVLLIVLGKSGESGNFDGVIQSVIMKALHEICERLSLFFMALRRQLFTTVS
jgi:hypothetical protein